jgi:hypothetical protein
MVGQKEKETIPTHTPRDSIMIFMKWGNNMILYEAELSHKFGFCVKFMELYKRLSSRTSLGLARNSWNYKRLSSHTSLGFVWNSWNYIRD